MVAVLVRDVPFDGRPRVLTIRCSRWRQHEIHDLEGVAGFDRPRLRSTLIRDWGGEGQVESVGQVHGFLVNGS